MGSRSSSIIKSALEEVAGKIPCENNLYNQIMKENFVRNVMDKIMKHYSNRCLDEGEWKWLLTVSLADLAKEIPCRGARRAATRSEREYFVENGTRYLMEVLKGCERKEYNSEQERILGRDDLWVIGHKKREGLDCLRAAQETSEIKLRLMQEKEERISRMKCFLVSEAEHELKMLERDLYERGFSWVEVEKILTERKDILDKQYASILKELDEQLMGNIENTLAFERARLSYSN